MTEASLPRSRSQRALLWLYRQLRQSWVFRSALGQRAFEEAYLLYKVGFEAGPIARLEPNVAPGTWAIDVGANIGMFSERFTQWVSSSGRVIAIEPEAINFASLTRRLAVPISDRRLIAIQAVAAEFVGELQLEINPNHPGDHRIGTSGMPIAAVSLDALMSNYDDAPVSLIKIDVQGAEMRVLRGSTELLKRCRPALFIEIDAKALKGQNATVAELLDFLSAYGYRPYRLRRFGAPRPILSRAIGQDHYEDVLFLGNKGSDAP